MSSKVFRSTASSDSIVFDFIDINEIDSILVRSSFNQGWGHGDLTIKANATDSSWGAPAFTTTLSVDTDWDIAFKTLAAPESYRFWQVTGTGASYFELSNIFFGTKYIPSTNITFNWSVNPKDNSQVSSNRYGQRFIDELNTIDNYTMAIKTFDKDQVDNLNEFYDYCGTSKTFWMIMDIEELFSNSAELFAGQFYFTSRPGFTNPNFGRYDSSMKAIECI